MRKGSIFMGGRRAVAVGAVAALTSVMTPASPANAGLLDPLAPVVGVVEGIIGTPVPTGWLYDGSATTMAEVRSAIGADTMWARGYTGRGVGVALVDTGVVPVQGLVAGNVVNGADLSFESQADGLRYYDTFGHGTHMAGIIAGNDTRNPTDPARFRGVAPSAKLTSIKVGAADGAVDVSQVIAAVDWVVKHRNDDPKNPIRVLNLSYGTDGVQSYQVDPLTHAVENAWRAGIVVVVSGGNDGFGAAKLNNPAYDPHVLAVGAADLNGTAALTADDTVPSFSSRGDSSRRVDVTAPGRSIVSLRDPGSYIDEAHPQARYGDQFFKGSGTSQSAAVVSGAVALLLEQRPSLTPNQVKALLRQTASRCRSLTPPAGARARSTWRPPPSPRRRPASRAGRSPRAPVHWRPHEAPRTSRTAMSSSPARRTSSARGTPRSGRPRARSRRRGWVASGTVATGPATATARTRGRARRGRVGLWKGPDLVG